jgi:hypothetical protein
MTATFYAIPTDVGNAKDANAKALGLPRKYAAFAIGDGGGENAPVPTPKSSQKALLGEWRRAALNTLEADPKNPAQLIAEQVIPENVGGKWIREMGIYDEDGDLCYVSNAPPTYKPLLAEGSGKTQTVRMVIINTTGVTVELKIDPSLVLATREYADKAITVSMKAHTDADDPHPQYAKKTAVAKSISDAMTAHVDAENPHTQYATSDYLELMGIRFPRIGGVGISKSGPIDKAQAGNWFDVQSSGLALTLPKLAEVGIGRLFCFRSNRFGFTLSANGTDKIFPADSDVAVSTVQFLPGELVSVCANGNSWYVVGGGVPGSRFPAQLAIPGYQKLPSGLIVQWGTVAPSGTGPSRFSFPIEFPTAAMLCVGNTTNTGAWSSVHITPITKAIFEVSATLGASTYVGDQVAYIALGC